MGKKMMLDVNNLMKKKQNQKSGKRYKPMELNILQGWLGKKLKSTHPHLGSYTYKLKNDHIYSMPSWVKHLSLKD